MKKDKLSSTKLYHELFNTLNRYMQESDVTIFTCIGALEAVKADCLDALVEPKEEEDNI